MATLAIAALVALVALAPAGAVNRAYTPPRKTAYFGFTDTGEVKKFRYFARLVGQHPAVIGTTDTWGTNKLRGYFERWRQARARPMLSISTNTGYEGEEVISPRGIAVGNGDNYLLTLNRMFHKWGRPGYLRIMAEPNGHWNSYSAYNSDGSRRNAAHNQRWYRQAWRRITIMVKDGGKRGNVNARLQDLGLPPVQKPKGQKLSSGLWHNRLATLWVPQTFGSPDVADNRPAAYWPGSEYVDWVGTDFYSKFPTWSALNGFYHDWKRKPFVFGEWGVWGSDDPGFVRRFFKWQRAHKRVRMFVYYNGLTANPLNPFNIEGRPQSRRVLRKQLRHSGYPPYAREWRHPSKKHGGGGGVGSPK